jgi:hypothetical protein
MGNRLSRIILIAAVALLVLGPLLWDAWNKAHNRSATIDALRAITTELQKPDKDARK